MRRSPTPIRNEKDFLKKNRTSKKYHSTFWAILFYINLMTTFSMFYTVIDQTIGFKCCIDMIFSKYQDARKFLQVYPEFNNDDFYKTVNFIKKCIKFSLIGTAIANSLHFLYAIIFPSLYISVNLFANLLLFLSPAAFLIYRGEFSFLDKRDKNFQSILFCITSVILGIIGICLFFYRRRLVKTSSSMMKAASTKILKHPSLFIFEIWQSLLLFAINALYFIGITISRYYAAKLNLNPFIYLYAGFSYYWILMTVYYVGYMTIAGVIGYEFYLGNRSSMPKFIVLSSFNRAISYQFGCACYAGLILALFQTLKTIIEWLKPDDNKQKEKDENDLFLFSIGKTVKKIFYYSLYCLILIFEKMFKNVSKNALIYCSIFGSSYSNACYRWKKQSFSSKFAKFQHSSMISGALLTNYFISSIFAICFALALCFKYIDGFKVISNISYLTVLCTIILMTSFYYMLNSLITTTSDTLYLCFLEHPNLFDRQFNSLYQNLEKVIKN